MILFVITILNKQLNNSKTRSLQEQLSIDNFWYDVSEDSDEAALIYYSGEYPASITIPATISVSEFTFKITSIKAFCFSKATFTTFSFASPSNLKVIHTNAFKDCIFSDQFAFPESLDTFESKAFIDCTFSDIILLNVIENDANLFYHCVFNNNPFSEQISRIGDQMFLGCTFNAGFSFPDGLYDFGQHPFSFCTFSEISFDSFSQIISPAIFISCTIHKLICASYIRGPIFEKCTFSVIDFYPSLEIGLDTFYHCTFSEVILPSLLTTLHQSFTFCSFQTLKFPDALETIEYDACIGISVKLIYLPQNLKEIYDNAFPVSNIEEIHFPPSLHYIGCAAFSFSNVTKVIFDDVSQSELKVINELCFSFCASLQSIAFPFSLEKIMDFAFTKCSALKAIYNLDNITYIGQGSFAFCYQLSSPIMMSDVTTVLDTFSFAFTGIKSVYIGGTIGDHAFYHCSSLTDVLFTAVIEIGESAFEGCQGIKNEIKFPDGLEKIGKSAFSECINMIGSIEMPSTLKEIGEKAFYLCLSLSGLLDIGKTQITEIKKYTFFKCSNMIGYLPFPPTVTKIGECAFSGCHFTGSLVLPDTLTLISDYAFYDNQFFTGNLNIGPQVTEIGKHAFEGCTGFNGQLIFHGESLTKIGHSAFFGCSNLSGILELPSSLETIGDYAFFGCIGFKEKLELPKSLKTIGNGAFAECSGFSGQLVIVNSITHIGKNAFFRCSGLTEIKFEEENINVEDNAFGSLHLTCFRNIPKNCTNFRVGDRCYNPDLFDAPIGVLNMAFVRERCSLYYPLNIILDIIISGTAATVAGIFVTHVTFIISIIWGERKRMNAIITDIIQKEVKHLEEEPKSHFSVAMNITDAIRGRLAEEFDDSKGNVIIFSKDTIESMIKDALKKEWLIAPKKCNTIIMEESLKGIHFIQGKDCCCGKCICYKKECKFIRKKVDKKQSTDQNKQNINNKDSNNLKMDDQPIRNNNDDSKATDEHSMSDMN